MMATPQQIERDARERAWHFAKKTMLTRERAFEAIAKTSGPDHQPYLDAEAKLAAARADFDSISRELESNTSMASLALRIGDDFT
jgi:hypothetical protein